MNVLINIFSRIFVLSLIPIEKCVEKFFVIYILYDELIFEVFQNLLEPQRVTYNASNRLKNYSRKSLKIVWM